MEEREYQRYTYTHPYDEAYEIVDKKIDTAMKPEDVAELLNKQTKHIKELEEQIEQMTKDYASEIAFWGGASDKQLAIEKLEKVKELIHSYVRKRKKECEVGYYDEIPKYRFDEIIDNQIKKLGGGENENR